MMLAGIGQVYHAWRLGTARNLIIPIAQIDGGFFFYFVVKAKSSSVSKSHQSVTIVYNFQSAISVANT